MALIIINKSECALCGKILSEKDEVISLPAISNTSSPLYSFFDQGFHKSCFQNWDKKAEIETLLKEERADYEQSDFYREMLIKYGKPKN